MAIAEARMLAEPQSMLVSKPDELDVDDDQPDAPGA